MPHTIAQRLQCRPGAVHVSERRQARGGVGGHSRRSRRGAQEGLHHNSTRTRKPSAITHDERRQRSKQHSARKAAVTMSPCAPAAAVRAAPPPPSAPRRCAPRPTRCSSPACMTSRCSVCVFESSAALNTYGFTSARSSIKHLRVNSRCLIGFALPWGISSERASDSAAAGPATSGAHAVETQHAGLAPCHVARAHGGDRWDKSGTKD